MGIFGFSVDKCHVISILKEMRPGKILELLNVKCDRYGIDDDRNQRAPVPALVSAISGHLSDETRAKTGRRAICIV
jgi:hypothetical protein